LLSGLPVELLLLVAKLMPPTLTLEPMITLVVFELSCPRYFPVEFCL
jgi:hypothetical protein